MSYAPVHGVLSRRHAGDRDGDRQRRYFFQSWTGDSPSATASYTFAITKNTTMTARFLPTGTVQDMALVGYAAVQDDTGRPTC